MEFTHDYRKPHIIAEIGCNHMGSMDIAKELILLAKECGANVAKFQKRDNNSLLTKEQYNNPHPVKEFSYGNSYGSHREFLEFDEYQHRELKKFCESKNIEYSTSVWESCSASQIVKLNPKFIKVPSASNNNFEMLEILRDDYKGEIHISFGMTTQDEEKKIIEFFEEKKQSSKRVIIYACTSGYPVPFNQVALLELKRLYKKYKSRVKEIGFSGHHLGIAVDIAAYTLGARWIERHFTKDRTWKGTDHAASLEPQGLNRLVRDLNASFEALCFKEKEILEIEIFQREKLKFKK